MRYAGQDAEEERPLLGGVAKDIFGVRIMLRIVGHCFWNYYEAKEKRREQGY